MDKVNPKWKAEIESKLFQEKPIDVTSGFNQAIQWLIVRLATAGVPYKLYNLGAGVKRVTTDTDTCPCCRRKL